MPIYKGFNYVLLALYAKEIENGHFKIKNVKDISEQIIYSIFFQRYRMETCLKKLRHEIFRRENSRQGDYSSSSFPLGTHVFCKFFQFAWAARVKGKV